MKMIKKFFLIIAFWGTVISLNAQHLYYRLDVATNNIYSFAAANLATAGLNALADKMLFDNAYTYTYLHKVDDPKDLEVKSHSIMGLTARELFSDVTAGGKMGWQSFYPGMFNWGVYGSAHYRINQYNVGFEGTEDVVHHSVQRLLLGGGFLFNIGDIESSTRLVFEAGLRYEIPLKYKGVDEMKTSDMMNSGLSSHFAVRVNGNGALQGLGVYADIPHYDFFKHSGKQFGTPNLNMFTFGIIYTITPWKIKDLYY